jgi:uncharacterized protein YdeI (YjbR/CyaY-like superfamily)
VSEPNPQVDRYIERADQWQEALRQLRAVVLGCGLSEQLKWGNPCYTLEDRNIVLIHQFKDYCALLFFKGALLQDPQGILVQQTQNTQAARQIRFTDAAQVVKLKTALKAYVRQAIEVEKAGLKVDFKETAAFEMPLEFRQRLDKAPALKRAFEALTPGRQRAYLLHFSQAKQAATRAARVERNVQRILDGKGLDDR